MTNRRYGDEDVREIPSLEPTATGEQLRLGTGKEDAVALNGIGRTYRMRNSCTQFTLALRTLRRSPGFSLTIIATLAMGIGFSTAVFVVARKLLFESLPVRDEARLVVLKGRTADGRLPNFPLSVENARTFARDSRSLERAALFTFQSPLPQPVMDGEGVTRLLQSQVSGDFFEVLGTHAVLGRLLNESDDKVGADPVAVLSFDTWKQTYAGDPEILGHRIRVHSTGITYTVVGVAPPGVTFPRQTAYWVPIATSTSAANARFTLVNLIGRLSASHSANDARTDLGAFFVRPDLPSKLPALVAVAEPFRTVILGDTQAAVLAISGAVILLIVITCVNVAGLVLVRGIARSQEFAIRSSLGAQRSDLVLFALAEAAILAAFGGVLGVLVAQAGLKLFLAFAPADIPRLSEIRLDSMAVLAAAAITIVVLLASSLAPAWRQSRVDGSQALKSGTRQSMGRRSRRAVEILVAGQVALALVILSSAALMARSVINLERAQLGFDVSHLIVADLSMSVTEYENASKQTRLIDRIIPAIGNIPGVLAVSPSVAPPFSGLSGWSMRPRAEGQAKDEALGNPMLNVDVTGPDYFQALGVQFIAGRQFNDGDRENTAPVVIISETTAKLYWPGQNPLGKRFIVRGDQPDFTVVGVVPDTRYRDLHETSAGIYFPLHQSFFPFAPATLLIRTTVPAEFVLKSLRAVVASTAQGVTVSRAQAFDDFLREPLSHPRMNALLLALFAAAAVILAGVGLFGAMATLVRYRDREMAIRVALGATSRNVLTLVIARGLGIAAVGVTAGCVASIVANRGIESLFYGVHANDMRTLAGAVFFLLVVAAIASLVPAIAAMRVDPTTTLRSG